MSAESTPAAAGAAAATAALAATAPQHRPRRRPLRRRRPRRRPRRPSRFRLSKWPRSRRSRRAWLNSRPSSAVATKRPAPNRSSSWPPRARSRTHCAPGAKRRKSRSTPSGRAAPRSRNAPSATPWTARSRAFWRRSRWFPAAPSGSRGFWRNQFVVEPAGDSFNVRTPAFQSVGDFVQAQLAKPEYAHFVRASNPGGGTATPATGGGGSLAAPTALRTRRRNPRSRT